MQQPKKLRLEQQDAECNTASNPFLQCADFILPWLTPQELANVSLACKTLNLISKSVTFRRSLDASRSLENLPVPFCATVDRHPYAYFIYTPCQVFASSSPSRRQPWGSALETVLGSPSRAGSFSSNGSGVLRRSDYGADTIGTSRPGVDSASQGVPASRCGSSGLPGQGFDSMTRSGSDAVSRPVGVKVSLSLVDGSGQSLSRCLPDAGSVLPAETEGDFPSRIVSDSARSSDSRGRLRGVRVCLVDELSESLAGCWCERCEEDEASGDAGYCCPCLGLEGLGIASECGPGCECGADCPNRLTQKGISIRLKIVRDEKKGWGLHADQCIKQGQFVCEYAGELLNTEEARRRQQFYDKLSSSSDTQFSSALLVIREHLPSGKACLRINIDATMIGNIARFINHSCDGGNLSTVLVRSSGAILPRLCFFASRDIEQDDELSFSYGDVRVSSNGLRCFCGSSCCCRTLPSEET